MLLHHVLVQSEPDVHLLEQLLLVLKAQGQVPRRLRHLGFFELLLLELLLFANEVERRHALKFDTLPVHFRDGTQDEDPLLTIVARRCVQLIFFVLKGEQEREVPLAMPDLGCQPTAQKGLTTPIVALVDLALHFELFQNLSADQLTLLMTLVERRVGLFLVKVAVRLAELKHDESFMVRTLVEHGDVVDRFHHGAL